MKRTLLYILVAILAVSGCITNDIPYPVVVPNIVSMDVEGAKNIDVDVVNRIVTIHMPETADLRNVTINSVQFNNDITVPSAKIEGDHDFTKPFKVT